MGTGVHSTCCELALLTSTLGCQTTLPCGGCIVEVQALARDGVSREVPCSARKGETVPDSLPATPRSPPTRRVPPRGTPRATLQGPCGRSQNRRGSLRFLPPLEMRPSSIAQNPAESREALPTPQHPSPLRGTLGISVLAWEDPLEKGTATHSSIHVYAGVAGYVCVLGQLG